MALPRIVTAGRSCPSGPWQTVLCTPGVVNTPRIIERDIDNLWGSVYGLVARASWHADPNTASQSQRPDLVIVDELRPLMPPFGVTEQEDSGSPQGSGNRVCAVSAPAAESRTLAFSRAGTCCGLCGFDDYALLDELPALTC